MAREKSSEAARIYQKSHMKKNLTRNALCFLTLLILFAPVFVFAQDLGTGYLDELHIPQGETDLPQVIINIVNIVLGLLALIAVIIVLIGGFEWMTAAGSEEKVDKAKKRLIAGLIGLAIIFLAYALVTFVLNKLGQVAS